MSKAKRTSGTKATKTTDTNGAPGELEVLRLPELQARYRDVVGETTKSPNRKFLIGRITEVLAARPESQVPEASPDENVSAPAESAEVVPAAEPTQEQDSTSATFAAVATAAEATEDQAGTPASPPADAPIEETAPESASAAEQPQEKKTRGRFAAMSIADLQALYLEKVGRSTGSEHRGYLIWKIREAEKGRITVGPVQARTATGETRDMKVLPLSLETTTVEKMDAAWRAKGIKTRAEFLRKAIGSYLTQLGASEEAALFAGE